MENDFQIVFAQRPGHFHPANTAATADSFNRPQPVSLPNPPKSRRAGISSRPPRLYPPHKSGKRLAYDLVGARGLRSGDSRQNFQLRNSIQQWRNQRLHRHQRPVARPRITPRFQIMGERQMQVRCREVSSSKYPRRTTIFALPSAWPNSNPPVRSHRVAAQIPASPPGPRSKPSPGRHRCLLRFRRFMKNNRLPDVPQRRVQRKSQQMNFDRLPISRHHQRLTAVLQKSFAHCSTHAAFTPAGRVAFANPPSACFAMNPPKPAATCPTRSPNTQPVIRIYPRQRHQALDRIQPVQRILRFLYHAAFGKPADVVVNILFRPNEIAVQRNNHFGGVIKISRGHRLAERLRGRRRWMSRSTGSCKYHFACGNFSLTNCCIRCRDGELLLCKSKLIPCLHCWLWTNFPGNQMPAPAWSPFRFW